MECDDPFTAAAIKDLVNAIALEMRSFRSFIVFQLGAHGLIRSSMLLPAFDLDVLFQRGCYSGQQLII
jgi:hypothetical protein